jgi:peroxiredoxin
MSTNQAPPVGERVEDFTLLDSDGVPWTLSSRVASGWCVLVFYRGHW